jgi:hypothetical protein
MTARRNGNGALAASRKSGKPPGPPTNLGDAGSSTWRLCWQLAQIRWPDDEPLVERLCRVEDEMEALRSEVQAQGVVLMKPVQTAGGRQIGTEPMVHPALLALRRAGAEAGELCGSLGIGARERYHLGLLVAERGPDKIDELKARRNRRRAAMKRTAAKAEG